jgi:hypothetical protein
VFVVANETCGEDPAIPGSYVMWLISIWSSVVGVNVRNELETN